jgi:preprotein translocase subunit SecY
MGGNGGLIPFIVEIAALLFVVIFTILIVQGVRKIPVQYAKKIVGNKQYGGVRQYIPLKVNAAGVMPIIFAQAIMFIPATIGQFFPGAQSSFLTSLSNYTSLAYNLTFAIMIIAFTFFYTAITVNPVQMSDDMKKNGGFIPGVKPGVSTGNYIDAVILVGVVLDTLQQIESHLLMRHYDGLMKTGRIKGRTAVAAGTGPAI